MLGCTHYPFLAGVIADVLGSGVAVIDTGLAVARQTARVLEQRGLQAPPGEPVGSLRLLTTGDVAVVRPVAARLRALEPGAVGADDVAHVDV